MTRTEPGAAAKAADIDLAEVDLSDPRTFWSHDMDAVWRRLRDEHPVHRHPDTPQGRGFWVLSRYDDVMAMYKDSQTFLSGPGNMLESLQKPQGDPAAGEVLFMADAPDHQPLRAILMKSFTPAIRQFVVERLATRVEKLITDRIGTGSFDFASEVAEEIPIWVICDLLGFPEEDRPRLLELSRSALSADSTDQTPEERWVIRNELLVYCSQMLEEKRDDPRDDLLSRMAFAEVNGEPLTDQQIILNCYGFLLAGDHTSRLAMIGAMEQFGRRPDHLARLNDGAVDPGAVVEEVIRWTTPVQHVGRTAAADVELRGRHIRRGDIVTAWNISANRDERVFADPDTFIPDRSPNKHVGLGNGPHFCLGAFLGRAEIGAVLSTLCKNVTEIEITGAPKPMYSTFLRGYSGLELALR
ncbi:cytochrome P450 [Streptomyces sp. NPDC088253]|uniref:cytochrome P450 n=1 Tax=Streptomyces sp. NPDC088253 TaxID=3365846 RepID=UPI003814361B